MGGGTPSSRTGPSAGVGGSGPYVYAETSVSQSDVDQGALFTLTYDGSACTVIGLRISTVTFYYHMYGATIGTLEVTNAAGGVVWSLSGNQGNSWKAKTVDVHSPSFAFEYTKPGGEAQFWLGDAAVALVKVSCGAGPSPSPLPAPPPQSAPAPITCGPGTEVSATSGKCEIVCASHTRRRLLLEDTIMARPSSVSSIIETVLMQHSIPISASMEKALSELDQDFRQPASA